MRYVNLEISELHLQYVNIVELTVKNTDLTNTETHTHYTTQCDKHLVQSDW